MWHVNSGMLGRLCSTQTDLKMEHTSTKKRTVGTFQRYEKLKYTICISPMAMHLDECKCYCNRDMYWLVGIDNLLASCMKSWRICTAAKTHEAQTRHQLWCSKNMHTIVKNIHNYMLKICYIYISIYRLPDPIHSNLWTNFQFIRYVTLKAHPKMEPNILISVAGQRWQRPHSAPWWQPCGFQNLETANQAQPRESAETHNFKHLFAFHWKL